MMITNHIFSPQPDGSRRCRCGKTVPAYEVQEADRREKRLCLFGGECDSPIAVGDVVKAASSRYIKKDSVGGVVWEWQFGNGKCDMCEEVL